MFFKTVLFFSHGTTDSFSDDETQRLNSSQSTLKTVKHGDASIMIWRCFSCYGVGPIYHIPGIMDQFEYINILEEVMLVALCQKGNALEMGVFNKTTRTNTTLREPRHNIYVMQGTSKSLDLGPIENLWDDMKNACF